MRQSSGLWDAISQQLEKAERPLRVASIAQRVKDAGFKWPGKTKFQRAVGNACGKMANCGMLERTERSIYRFRRRPESYREQYRATGEVHTAKGPRGGIPVDYPCSCRVGWINAGCKRCGVKSLAGRYDEETHGKQKDPGN